MSEPVVILCALALIVLGYVIRLLREVVRGLGAHPKSPQDDYIDWAKVPEGYDYVGINGECSLVYMAKTKLKHDGIWLSSKDGSITNAPADAIIGPLPPWRDSLRCRPKAPR